MNLVNGNFITLDDQCPAAEMISIENRDFCQVPYSSICAIIHTIHDLYLYQHGTDTL